MRNSGRPWTPLEDQELCNLARVYTHSEISPLLGRSVLAVAARCHRLSITARHPQRSWSSEEDELLRAMAPVSTMGALRRKFGRTYGAIKNRLKLLDIRATKAILLMTPTKAEWVACAEQAGKLMGVSPVKILAGVRDMRTVRARRRAFMFALKLNEKYSVAGVARVSGFHHTSVMYALRRHSGASVDEIRANGRRVSPAEMREAA